jgi:hypothetical protein
MKTRIALLLLLVLLMLVSAGAGAQATPRYQVQAGVIAGEGYRLTTLGTQAETVSAGGAYRLLGPSAPAGQGSGCCCTYLPCVPRNW